MLNFSFAFIILTVNILSFFSKYLLILKINFKYGKLLNIWCFIVYILILLLDSFRKHGIVFGFFALEYEVYWD